MPNRVSAITPSFVATLVCGLILCGATDSRAQCRFAGSPSTPTWTLFLMKPGTALNTPDANMPRRLSRDDWTLINFVSPTPVVLIRVPKKP
jgi:hypothetical protein